MRLVTSIIVFLLFITGYSQEQQVIVLDSSTHNPIPYSTITFIGKKGGLYSNERGVFKINTQQNDSIRISCLGYSTLTMKVRSLKNKVYLKPEVIQLDQVNLLSEPSSFKKIGFKKATSGWFGIQGLQIGLLIKPNKKYKETFINSIIIPFRKKILGKKKNNYNSVFKLSIFSVQDSKQSLSLLDEPILIYHDQDSEKKVEIDVSQEYISFSKEGLFIVIEQVGRLNKKREVINKEQVLPGLGFSTKDVKDFSSMHTYYKHSSSEDWEAIDLKKMHLKEMLYLAIQLVMVKYEY